MRPPPANHQSGNNIFKLRQARAEHPTARSAGTTRAGLAVRPPLISHQSSICAMCTQLRTQNTMGTGGGVSGAQSTLRYHFITFPFTFKDIALVQLLQNNSTLFPINNMSFTYTYQKCCSAPTHFLVNRGFTASLY